jgi:hypothetical protein
MEHTNQKGLKLSGACQLLVYGDDVDILQGDIYILLKIQKYC